MKKIFSLLITLCSLAAFGQYPVSNISITLPPNLAANTGDWAMPFVITAQAKLVQGQVPGNLMESRILVTIKSGGGKICGSYTQQTAPLSNFNSATKSWSGAAAVSLLGNACALQPGVYELCVQFFSSYAPVVPLSNEVCKTFTIADNKQITYAHPQNLAPAANKNFTKQEIKQPILFRWTQVTPPPPNNDVMYTVHVYAVEKGQSPVQAVKTNTPVFEKQVNTTQTIWQVPLEFTSSNETLTFVWNVQATDKKGKPYGADHGISEPTVVFIKGDEGAVKNPNDATDTAPPINVQPFNGQNFTQPEAKKPITFKWKWDSTDKNIMYTVSVYVVEKGQTPAQAIKINKPVFEKQVNTKETTWQMPVEYTNVKETKTFVWNVRAKNIEGKSYGTSEATTFNIIKAATIKEIPTKVVPQPTDISKNKDCITYKSPIITGPLTGSLVQMNKENLSIRFVPSNTLVANYKVLVWRNNNQKRELIHEKIYPNNFNGTITGLKLSNKKTEELTVQMQAIAGKSISVRGDRAAFQKSSCAVFENNGFSNSSSFSVSSSCAADYSFSIDSAICVDGKKVRVYCHVVFNNINSIPTPNPTLTNATFVDNATNLPIVVSNFSTSLSPLSLLPAGTSIPFSFDAEGETCDKTIRITYDINWNCPSGPQHIIACVDSFKLPCCYCNYCDKPENMNIQDISHSATPVATDNLNVTQAFNISPKNISKITAEIVYMEEDQMDPACKQCRKNENVVYHFIGTNTAAWNSGTPLNAASDNNASTFPTKILTWSTNAQGNLAFSLTIGLPGTAPLKCCERHGKVCIRYSFTDIECKTCTQLVCYTY